MEPVIPNQKQLLASIPENDKVRLYQHFEGAANPDELIYRAWLWANGWIHDPVVKTEWLIDPATGERTGLTVLDLDNEQPSLQILYEFWEMDAILPFLKENF